MTEYIQIITTAGSKEEADRISQGVVEQHLAACGQVSGPITSAYWWKEQLETAEEWRVVFKTRRVLFTEVEKAIRALHSYEVPQIVALPLLQGAEDYLAWIDRETRF